MGTKFGCGLCGLLLALSALTALTASAFDWRARMVLAPLRMELSGEDFASGVSEPIQVTDASIPPEGFRLRLAPGRLEIASSTPTGARRGARELARLRRIGGGLLPEAVIESAPQFPMRGAFMNWRMIEATPEAMTELKHLMRALAELGVNTLVIEFADNIRYDSQRFPAREGKAFSKDQIRELLATAKKFDIEIIPYFQALSHCVWILSNPENTRLLEDPSRTDWHTAWCPEKPETRRFFEDILGETVELFHPRYIHLSYDEINYGPYHQCEACRSKQPGQLLLDSIMADYDFLKARGVGVVLYHDQLIEPPNGPEGTSVVEGWTILDRLPRDIVINAWLYGDDPARCRRVLDYFAGRGFPVLGAGFENFAGLKSFAIELAATPGAVGLIDTYWYRAGDWSRFQIAPIAAASTTVTAAAAWNPGFPWPNPAIDPVAALAVPWLGWAPLTPGTAIQLSPASGFTFGDGLAQWPGPRFGALSPPAAPAGSPGLPATPDAASPLWAVSGRPGDGFPAEAPVLMVNRRASELAFVHACGLPDNRFALSYLFGSIQKPHLGDYRVRYADGSEEVLPLAYNDNIADWNSLWGPVKSCQRYVATGSDGELVGFSVWRWRNPYPEKVIATLTLESAHYENTALFAAAVYAFGAGDPPPLMIENFDVAPGEKPLAGWTVNAGGLNPGGLAMAGVAPLTEGSGAVELRTPGSAGAGARITLDLPIDWNGVPEMARRIFSFDLEVQSKTPFSIGVYLGNADWSAYRVCYIEVHDGFNQIHFAMDGLTPEAGKLAFTDARQLRLSFFLPGTPDPVRLTLDNLNCALPGAEVDLNRLPR